jgi:Na+/serine symporter
MMSRKLTSLPKFTRYQPLIQSTTGTIFNSSHEYGIITRQQSKIQRWIFGMITGSAPFLIILICWMFVSICVNNLVRFYQYRKNLHRQNIRTNGIGNIVPKINV